jgi:hypothetical protein
MKPLAAQALCDTAPPLGTEHHSARLEDFAIVKPSGSPLICGAAGLSSALRCSNI